MPRPSKAPLEKLTEHSRPGTARLVERLLKDSAASTRWRPVRAAAIRALNMGEVAKDHVWMTADEFAAFLNRMGLQRKRGANDRLKSDLGMSSTRKFNILGGGARMTKMEALACAHMSAGLDLPIPAHEPDAFRDWIAGNFEAVVPLADALDEFPSTITDRMAGYYMDKGARRPISPEPDLIRAIDWILRVGPVSPYGAVVPHVMTEESTCKS